MTRDRILSFARELAHLVKQAREAEAAIDAMSAQLEISKATGNTKEVEQLIKQRADARAYVEKVTSLVTQKANRDTLDGAERLLQQIETRLNEHGAYQNDAEVLAARLEMAATMGEFTTEDGATARAEIEGHLTTARERTSQQLELAAALVPSRPVILSL
jgi:uncharacterized lipoprotein NlpE involved in copper resistance